MQALLGGHVMAQCDATAWDKVIGSGEVRLLGNVRENRARSAGPQCLTAKEAGIRRGVELAVLHRSAERDGSRGDEEAARRVSQGDE
jgi:tripartite-type tricarboxylate transporter receptor subunit TctC